MFATLRRSGGIEALARRVGQAPAQVSVATELLITELIDCLRKYVATKGGEEEGVENLLNLLAEFGDGRLAADVMGPDPIDPSEGEAILDRIYAAIGVARPTIDEIADRNGLDPEEVGKVLPLLAMLLCGYIAARFASGGEGGDGMAWAIDLLVPHRRI